MAGRILELLLATLLSAPIAVEPARRPAPTPASAVAPASFQVTITGGPHAGTYTGSEVACFLLSPNPSSPKEFEVAFSRASSADPSGVNDPKVLTAVRIHVYDAAKAGPVTDGFAHVVFGPEKQPKSSTKYEVRLKSRKNAGTGTITLAVSGRTATSAFEGRTSQGIGMRITMHCTDLMAF